jgi:CoA-transferase family III
LSTPSFSHPNQDFGHASSFSCFGDEGKVIWADLLHGWAMGSMPTENVLHYLADGADVLLVTSPKLPALPLLDIETSLGKRTTQLDLTLPADRNQLISLANDRDVFLQAYRPGGLEEKGFGAHDLATLRPGIICANLTAWG